MPIKTSNKEKEEEPAVFQKKFQLIKAFNLGFFTLIMVLYSAVKMNSILFETINRKIRNSA